MSSATGGYLKAISSQINYDDLFGMLRLAAMGITGLTDVRAMNQENPPPLPGINDDWMAMSILPNDADPAGYLNSSGTQFIQQSFDAHCIFYGPRCVQNAADFRDGLLLNQNNEALFLQNICYSGKSTQIVFVPELYNDRYYRRADISLTFNRLEQKSYDILTLTDTKLLLDTGQ